jgi:hypothetical protein
MSRLRIQLLAGAGLVAIASFATASAASASVTGIEYGTGPTAAAAKMAATAMLHNDYIMCTLPVVVVYDTQNPDGTWSAEIAANCKYYA